MRAGRFAAGGLAMVTAGLVAGCEVDSGPLGSDEPRPIEVRLHPVGGGTVDGLTASWWPQEGGPVDSVAVEADGRVTIRRSSDGPGELRIDGPEPRSWHPVLIPIDPRSGWYRDLLLIPTRWTIRAGRHQGTAVDLRLDEVVDDRVSAMRYSYLWGRPVPFDDPDRYAVEVRAWDGDDFPARVAIDHANSTLPTSPGDSVALWGVLDGMEEAIGLDLFEPAVASWPAGTSENRIVESGVIRLLRLPGRWRGAHWIGASRAQTRDLGEWAVGERFTRYEDRRSRILSGTLMIGELDSLRLADGVHPWQTIAVHEALHVLGVGHTCRIASPMGPCMRRAEPTEFDVAWMELARAIVEMDAFDSVTLQGLIPSIVGERRLLLGLSALPDFARFEGGSVPGGLHR